MNTKELGKEIKGQLEEITETRLNADKTKEILELVFETIGNKIAQGEKIKIQGFGSFEAVKRAERKGRNPQTSEEIIIEAYTAPKFSAVAALKNKVKGI